MAGERSEKMMHGNRKDLTGQRFGRLVVIEPVTTGEYRNSVWLCQCDCGNKKIVPTYRLLNGRTFSCGCYRKQSKQVIEELAKVKTENEKLKAENTKLKKEVSDLNFYIDNYKMTWEIDKKEQYKQALEEIQNVLFPKNKLLITDCKGLLKTQEILNEVLKDE